MGESLNETNSSPQGLLPVPACVDEAQSVNASIPPTLCNHNDFINGHSKYPELRKRRLKSFPPPLTAALLKTSRQKLQTPPELVFTSDDDDDDQAAADAAVTQRLLSIGKKYLPNRNGKLTKAEKAQLNDTENPRPSTSTALIREMNRIQIQFQKASQSPSSVKPTKVKFKVQSITKPICSQTLRVEKTVPISKVRDRKPLRPKKGKTESSRRKRKPESLEESDVEEEPPDAKKTKEDMDLLSSSEPMKTEREPSLLLLQLCPLQSVVTSIEVESSVELFTNSENDKGIITNSVNGSDESEREVEESDPALRIEKTQQGVDHSQTNRRKGGTKKQTNQNITNKIRRRDSPARKMKKVSEIEAAVEQEAETIRRSSRDRRPRQYLDDAWIYI